MPESRTRKTERIIITPGTRRDSKAVIDLIIGLAKFELLEPPDPEAKLRLVKDIFGRKLARVFVAKAGSKLVGYALYFYTYSSFRARPTLYLEDIFVNEDARHEGVGEALFTKCLVEAKRHGCGRMEWTVLSWNRKAMRFYESFGAKRLSDLYLYRLGIRKR